MGLPGQIVDRLKRTIRWNRHPPIPLNDLFARFQQLLEENNTALKMIADMEDKLGGEYVFDRKYLEDQVNDIEAVLLRSAVHFNFITNDRYLEIYRVIEALSKQLRLDLSGQIVIPDRHNTLALSAITAAMREAVGDKAYNLSRVTTLPGANVPAGFVVTIAGFRSYLAYNNLFDKIDDLLDSIRRDGRPLDLVSQNIRLLILAGDVPPDLRRDILNAAEKCCPDSPHTNCFSVRSSAVGEDGELSFAGLHDSFLNVPFRELISSFKKVLAGLYNAASLEYRITRQVPNMDLAMAVLFQQMVSSRVAGVAYTVDPNTPREEVCLLGASWGLGRVVVEGSGAVDMFRVSRHAPYALLHSRIATKESMIAPFESDKRTPVSPEQKNIACLTPVEASLIVEAALTVERFFKRPMDIEWSLDTGGRLWILQSRPLGIPKKSRSRSPELKQILQRQTTLMENQGMIAYRGIAAGPVWHVEDDESLGRFPSGAVLVSRDAIPLLARAIPRASAVITDFGSPTGHMATVAREFRVPTIVDAGSATQVLEPGVEITVDAERNVVYAGRIAELLHHQLLEQASFETTYEFQLLRRLLKRIAPLTLIDPEGPNFTAQGCQTFHDLLRFIHEKSTQALAQVAEDPGFLRTHGGKRLKAKVPLDLILIDIGGGLETHGANAGSVVPEQIASAPMKALWEGLSFPDAWSTRPVSADFKGLMSSLTRTQTAPIAAHGLAGLNVAVLGTNYLNLSLRVGYHFTVVDASLGPLLEKNSIFFRFIGGATDITRRSRRAALLLTIMEKIGFKVEGKGDLVIARATHFTMARGQHYLYLVGRLIGFARQLDILMTDDSTVKLYSERFMAGCDMDTGNSHHVKEASK